MRQRADGHTLASLNPCFQVFLPSRFHDPAIGNLVGRPIVACYEVEPNGDRARGGACEQSSANGTLST